MIFPPAPFSAGRRALAALALLAVINLALLAGIIAKPVAGSSFILLLLFLLLWLPILYLAWRAWVCFSLSYWIDRNAISLVWGPVRQIIPLGNVQEIRRGQAVAALMGDEPLAQGPNGEVDWLSNRLAARWPRLTPYLCYGPELGTRRRVGGLRINSLATRPLAEQILLVTPDRVFGITPADPERFLQAMEEFHRLGPVHLVKQQRRWPAIARWPLWQDRLLMALLAAGFLGFLALLGIAIYSFTSLPYSLPQWDNLDRRLIFIFPAFGLAVWLINGAWGLLVHGRHRVGAALLFGGTLAAQLAALIALLSVIGG